MPPDAPAPWPILIAEDDEDDRLLAEEAFEESRLRNPVHFVPDGVEALAFLRREGAYADARRPGLVLLDLNMPRMDGREALAQIKADPDLRSIPVVILTTSKAQEDVLRSYDLGVSGYITKPVTMGGLTKVLEVMADYWFQIVRLPGQAA